MQYKKKATHIRHFCQSLDEGFVHFEADRIELVDHIFDLLRNTFDFTLIISHLEKLNESVDIQYNVKKVNNRSTITKQINQIR